MLVPKVDSDSNELVACHRASHAPLALTWLNITSAGSTPQPVTTSRIVPFFKRNPANRHRILTVTEERYVRTRYITA